MDEPRPAAAERAPRAATPAAGASPPPVPKQRVLAASSYLDQYDDTIRYQSRTDRYYNAGINFTHQLRRYLSWGLGYEFQKRDTQAEGLSYIENAVTATISVSF